jgi:hypothetical protein
MSDVVVVLNISPSRGEENSLINSNQFSSTLITLFFLPLFHAGKLKEIRNTTKKKNNNILQ